MPELTFQFDEPDDQGVIAFDPEYPDFLAADQDTDIGGSFTRDRQLVLQPNA